MSEKIENLMCSVACDINESMPSLWYCNILYFRVHRCSEQGSKATAALKGHWSQTGGQQLPWPLWLPVKFNHS